MTSPRNGHQVNRCEDCGELYSIDQMREDAPDYFPPPYHYDAGAHRYCLTCWLGVGPEQWAPGARP